MRPSCSRPGKADRGRCSRRTSSRRRHAGSVSTCNRPKTIGSVRSPLDHEDAARVARARQGEQHSRHGEPSPAHWRTPYHAAPFRGQWLYRSQSVSRAARVTLESRTRGATVKAASRRRAARPAVTAKGSYAARTFPGVKRSSHLRSRGATARRPPSARSRNVRPRTTPAPAVKGPSRAPGARARGCRAVFP
jgi:hypothetical protein